MPKVVTPGKQDAAPPSDAIVLFDGHDLSQWETSKDHSPARWHVHNGVVTVDKTTGNIQTRQHFRNYQLHLEWQVPKGITGEGQARGNSGLFLASAGPGDEGYEAAKSKPITDADAWEKTSKALPQKWQEEVIINMQ